MAARLIPAVVLFSAVQASPQSWKNETLELIDWVSSHKDMQGKPYRLESHTALSEDGVKLTLFRLARPGSSPLLLQHGVLDSTWMWVINPTVKSIALQLYDFGFDVWMANNRGNYFSSAWNRSESVAHSDAFWNFSFADMGIFDVPANIDYILNHTGKAHLQYVGHSQGTTQFFIAAQTPGLSEFLQKKVSQFIALSPVAFIGNTTSQLMVLMAQLGVASKMRSLFPHSFMDSSTLLDVEHAFCVLSAGVICQLAVGTVVGDGLLDSPAAIDKYSDHFPLGTSVKDIEHFAQFIRSNAFQKFDYGPAGNQVAYGRKTPPSYDLSRFNISSALFFGEDDDFVRPGDQERLLAALPEDVVTWKKSYHRFSHVTWHVGVESATSEFYSDLFQQLTAGQEGNDAELNNVLV